MQTLNYLYNQDGSKTGLLINFDEIKKLSIDEIEDVQDIIDYELSSHIESVDYDKEISRILNNLT